MVRKIDIILAAPGDAETSRTAIEAVVDQLNLGAAQRAGLRLDLTLLDDGFLPPASEAREAILITVLWTSFSRSNMDHARAARVRMLAAYDKYHGDAKTIAVLPFFNNEPVTPNHIDPDQLAMVRAFQERLRSDGLRSYNFDGREDLRILVENKLERMIADLPPLDEPEPEPIRRQEPVFEPDAERDLAPAMEPSAERVPPPADIVPMDGKPRVYQKDDKDVEKRLAPPSLASAANDDRFVLTAMAPVTPELLHAVDRKAWEMIEAFDLIGDIIGFMASDTRRHLRDRQPNDQATPELGLIFKMMSRKEEDELAAFSETAEDKITMLKEIYQTGLTAMRQEFRRRLPVLEASDFDEETMDEAFRAIAKFFGPLKAASPHLQAFRVRTSGLRRTTAEFHKAKLRALEFLDRYLSDLSALRGMLARDPAFEVSSRV
ncbi:MAG TPA: hypothetical protein VKA19_04800 [Alphaproteobacteria bacterium]|nr:hypothetical protein [Alphaproteobacteria bacterium]